MDVELQILKHLKRSPRPTVAIIDQYCESYNDLSTPKAQAENLIPHFNLHQQWSNQPGWKTTLNNLRLIIQPAILFWINFLSISLMAKFCFSYFLISESDRRRIYR